MGEISYFLKELPKKLQEMNSIKDLKIDVYKNFNVNKMQELSVKIKEEEIPYLEKLEKSLILIDRFKRRYGDKISGDFRLIVDAVDRISNIFERKHRFGKARIIEIAELQSKALKKYKWDLYKRLLHEENELTGEFKELLTKIEPKEIEMIRKSKSVYLNRLFDWVTHPGVSVFSKLAAACCLTLALAGASLGQTTLDVDVGQMIGLKGGKELTASVTPTMKGLGIQKFDLGTNILFKNVYLDLQKTNESNLHPMLSELFASKLTYWKDFDRLFIKGLSLKTRSALAYMNLPNIYYYLDSEKVNSNHILMYGFRLGLDFRKIFGKNEVIAASDINARLGHQVFPNLTPQDFMYSTAAFSDLKAKFTLQFKRHLTQRLLLKFDSMWDIFSIFSYPEFKPKLKPELNMELLKKFNNWYFGIYSNYDLGTKEMSERGLMGLGMKLNTLSNRIGISVGVKIDPRKKGVWAFTEARGGISFRFGGVRYKTQRLEDLKEYKPFLSPLADDYYFGSDSVDTTTYKPSENFKKKFERFLWEYSEGKLNLLNPYYNPDREKLNLKDKKELLTVDEQKYAHTPLPEPPPPFYNDIGFKFRIWTHKNELEIAVEHTKRVLHGQVQFGVGASLENYIKAYSDPYGHHLMGMQIQRGWIMDSDSFEMVMQYYNKAKKVIKENEKMRAEYEKEKAEIDKKNESTIRENKKIEEENNRIIEEANNKIKEEAKKEIGEHNTKIQSKINAFNSHDFSQISKYMKTPEDIADASSRVTYEKGKLATSKTDLLLPTKKQVSTYKPEETWKLGLGVCRDMAKFQVKLLNKIGCEAYEYGFISPTATHVVTVYKDNRTGKWNIMDFDYIIYIQADSKEEVVGRYTQQPILRSSFRNSNGDIIEETVSPTMREIEDFWNKHMKL